MKKRWIIVIALGLILSSFRNLIHTLPTDESTLFSGSGNCEMCHTGQSGVLVNASGRDVSPLYHWQSSMMANAAKDPYWQAKVSSEVEKNPHLQTIIEDKCVTCHAPMGRTEAVYHGAENYGFEEATNDALSLDGVSCTLCHQIDAGNLGEPESFSGHYVITDGAQIFGPYEDPFTTSMVNNTGYTPVHSEHVKSAALCATCHTLITPYVDEEGEISGYFPEQMPYYEWLNSSYPKDEKTCQTCHMPAVNESLVIASRPPWLETTRNPIFDHHFVGGNTVMVQLLKSNANELGVTSALNNLDTTLFYASRNLEQNTLDISSVSSYKNGEIAIEVEIVNKTGHKLPTGFPSRRMWIHFTAKDQNGDVVFESGKYDRAGVILTQVGMEPHHDTIARENEVQIYEAVMGNTSGQPTTVLLEAAQYLKDNRLPPSGFHSNQSYDSLIAITGKAKMDVNFNTDDDGIEGTGSDRVIYTFPFEGDALSYEVEVCYQSIKPEFSDHIAASETDHSQRFTQIFDDESLPKVKVLTIINEEVTIASVYEVEDLEWKLYPNPAQNDVTITGPVTWPLHYHLFAVNGILIDQGESIHDLIAFRNQVPGSYVLRVENTTQSKTFKMILE